MSSLELHDPATDGKGHSMGAIASAKLCDDISDMRFGRLLTDGECHANQLVRMTAGDELQYLDLARGQGRVARIEGDLLGDRRFDPLGKPRARRRTFDVVL
jgi:hypothetical protein